MIKWIGINYGIYNSEVLKFIPIFECYYEL